jgi:hypothetical protein
MFRPIALALGVALLAPVEARASDALQQDGDAVDDAAGRADVLDVDGEAPDGDTVTATADAEAGIGAMADASDGSALPDATESDGAATKADGAAAEEDSDAATQASSPFGAAAISGSAPPPPAYAPVVSSTPQNTGSAVGTSLADGIGSAAESCGSDDSSDDGSDVAGACAGSDATPDDCAMGRLASRGRRSPFSRIVVLLVAGAAVIRRKTRGA